MELKFTPCRMDQCLDAFVQGDCLTLNGGVLDFTSLQEGALLPKDAVDNLWVASDVERVDGVVRLTLRIPHGADAPQETLFPANFDTFMSVANGPVPIPVYEVTHD